VRSSIVELPYPTNRPGSCLGDPATDPVTIGDAVETCRLDHERSHGGREQEVVTLAQPSPDELRAGTGREQGRQEDVAGPGRIDPAIRSQGGVSVEPARSIRTGLRDEAAIVGRGDDEGCAGAQKPAQVGQLDVGRHVVPAQPHEVRPLEEPRRPRGGPPDRLADVEIAQQSLPGDGNDRLARRDVGPGVGQLGRDRRQDPGRCAGPCRRQLAWLDGVGQRMGHLDPTVPALDIVEDRSTLEGGEIDHHARVAQPVELARLPGEGINADEGADAEPKNADREGTVGDATAEPPATRIAAGEVARGCSDDDDIGRTGGRVDGKHERILADMFFYELHEGDEEIYSDVLLYSDSEWEPDEFFDLVQTVRRRIQDTYASGTLIEAIAGELEREHGFLFVSDDRLTAAVNVSTRDDDNFLAELDADLDDDEDDDEVGSPNGADYVSIYADLDPDGDGRPN
jgi:hypothetical protein